MAPKAPIGANNTMMLTTPNTRSQHQLRALPVGRGLRSNLGPNHAAGAFAIIRNLCRCGLLFVLPCRIRVARNSRSSVVSGLTPITSQYFMGRLPECSWPSVKSSRLPQAEVYPLMMLRTNDYEWRPGTW
jgi:hypothetical protein